MSHQPTTGSSPGYETRDANSVRLLVIGFGLLVLIAVVLGIIWGLYRAFGSEPPVSGGRVSATAAGPVIPPEPRLQANPSLDLDAMKRRDDSVLTTYAWVDRKAGIARIPVDTAIELLSRAPWPSRPAAAHSGEDRPR